MRLVKRTVVVAFLIAVIIFGAACFMEWVNSETLAPEITSDEKELEITCDYTEEQLLDGIHAYDAEDGDITSEVLVSEFSRFIEKGVCNVTYVVFDSSNQSATLTRQVRFTDYQSPRFYLTEPLVFTEGEGNYEKVLQRLRANDPLSGNLTDWITQTGSNVSYQQQGDYEISFEVTNRYGDTSEISLPVHVIDDIHTIDIKLTSNIVYVNAGEQLKPKEYIADVTDAAGEQMSTNKVQTASSVNMHAAGIYEIHYTVEDEVGNTGETWLTVVVQE